MSPSDGQRFPSPAAVVQSSHWVPPPTSRPSPPNHHHNHNHIRYPVPKHYGAAAAAAVPTTGVLPAPNGIQPLFMPAPAAAVPFPVPPPVAAAASTTGWPVVPSPRHHHPQMTRLPVPGTGVFLPPPGGSSGNSTQQILPTTTTTITTIDDAETSFSGDIHPLTTNGNGRNVSTKKEVVVDGGEKQKLECNGSMDAQGGGSSAAPIEEQQQRRGVDIDSTKVASEPAAAI